MKFVAKIAPLVSLLLFSVAWAQNSPVISLVANAEGEKPLIAPNTWVEIKGQKRLDPHTHRLHGPPFAVAHFHSSRRSMLNVGLSELEVAVGPDRIVFVQGEVTGNIWLTHLP